MAPPRTAGPRSRSLCTPISQLLIIYTDHLTRPLIECAWSASHTKNTNLGATFWRLARRIGKKKAAVAVGHSILVSAWHMLDQGVDYHELGPDHHERHHANHDRRRDRAVRDLHALGYRVTLDEAS